MKKKIEVAKGNEIKTIKTGIKKSMASGGITIPVSIRRQMGWTNGSAVDYKLMEDGTLVLKPIKPKCGVCEINDALYKVRGLAVCADCADAIKDEVGRYER